MTFDEAMEKVQALWPNANLKEQPIGAHGIVRILIAFDLLRDREKANTILDGIALMSAAHPEGEGQLPENIDIDPDSVETVELSEEQVAAMKASKGFKIDKVKEFNKQSPNKGFKDES
jgi:hypothetical protein